MPYTITHYAGGTPIVTVADGTVDQTLDLKLVGKNYAGYGVIQNENFVYLLENFANTNPPSRPIPGQLWYDTNNNKLKFYDQNLNWRTTGGSTTSASVPAGLTTGDFWYDSTNKQLYVWDSANPTQPVLVGPQGVSGFGSTQMKSVSLRDTLGNTHGCIEAISSNQVVYVINPDAKFTLDPSTNPITGFSDIQQGITLAYTTTSSQLGQTTSNHRFWGTASNSDRLGGLDITNFILSSNAAFTQLVQFNDSGYTVGSPSRLKVYNTASLTYLGDSTIYPTVWNNYNDKIVFQTTVGGSTLTPMVLVGSTVQPGTANANDIGTNLNPWRSIYATNFVGNASTATAVVFSSGSIQPAATATPNTLAARTSVDQTLSNGQTITAGSLLATYFSGIATSANYADLAEKYLADTEYTVGTVVTVGGEQEVTASKIGDRALGVVSSNPAFMMNSELKGGTYIALKGRVPVKVSAPIRKGDKLVAANDGTATASHDKNDDYFAIALETNNDISVKLVECVIL